MGGTAWYLVVRGQYSVVLVVAWWYCVSIGEYSPSLKMCNSIRPALWKFSLKYSFSSKGQTGISAAMYQDLQYKRTSKANFELSEEFSKMQVTTFPFPHLIFRNQNLWTSSNLLVCNMALADMVRMSDYF